MGVNKPILYWTFQTFGWFLYVGLNIFFSELSGKHLTGMEITVILLVGVLGILATHSYRSILVRSGWMNYSAGKLLARALVALIAAAVLFDLVYQGLSRILLPPQKNPFQWSELILEIFGWVTIMGIWSLIYFLYHYLETYRKEEIKNLQWEATKNEIELNTLKSQLNPHFLFNSMNSIKALISEEPNKAKLAITQLSGILRNSLQLGKKSLIPFEEEFNLIKDYLSLEMIRHEDRLKIVYDIDPASLQYMVPPMMVQTLMENGIKHGISKMVYGGTLTLWTKVNHDTISIRIINTGQLPSQFDENGYGLLNTKQRLEIIFGKDAKFSIFNLSPTEVCTELILPKTSNYDKNNNR